MLQDTSRKIPGRRAVGERAAYTGHAEALTHRIGFVRTQWGVTSVICLTTGAVALGNHSLHPAEVVYVSGLFHSIERRQRTKLTLAVHM
jgi:hypothetical protein